MFFIKDLKDLEKGLTRISIDIKVLMDLKRHILTMELAGETRSDARMETAEGPALREHQDQEVSPTEHIEI